MAQATGRQAGAAAGREPAGRACERRAAHEGSGAGDGRHHRAAQEHRFPDRRQAAARSNQGPQPSGPGASACGCGNPTAHHQARGNNSWALCSRQRFNHGGYSSSCASCARGCATSSATSGRGSTCQPGIQGAFQWPLATASQIRLQQQRQRGWKLYSFHVPEVECIGKGKTRARYEFSVKTSIAVTNVAPQAASSCCMPRRCPAIRTMDTRCGPPSKAPRS